MHLVIMELVMVEVMHQHIWTGSTLALFTLTMLFTVPAAWLLHRFTRVRN